MWFVLVNMFTWTHLKWQKRFGILVKKKYPNITNRTRVVVFFYPSVHNTRVNKLIFKLASSACPPPLSASLSSRQTTGAFTMSAYKTLLYCAKHRNLWTSVLRNVTTWSPVGAAFNAKPHKRQGLWENNVVRVCCNDAVCGPPGGVSPRLSSAFRVCLGCPSWAVPQVSRWPHRQRYAKPICCWRKPVRALRGLKRSQLLTSCQTVCAKWPTW